MSNKIKGLIVTLEESISDEDAENYIRAIELLKGVVSVETSVDNYDDHINRTRIQREISDKVNKAIWSYPE